MHSLAKRGSVSGFGDEMLASIDPAFVRKSKSFDLLRLATEDFKRSELSRATRSFAKVIDQ